MILLFIILKVTSLYALGAKTNIQINYGYCSPRLSAELGSHLDDEFQKNHSLYDVKKLILEKNLMANYFLSKYNVAYSPYTKKLKFQFECPFPLVRMNIYKGIELGESYGAILGDDGKLYSLEYEMLLKREGRLVNALPTLAFPYSFMETTTQVKLTEFIKEFPIELRPHVSELILNNKKELMIILSIDEKTSNVYLGEGVEGWNDEAVSGLKTKLAWEEKLLKLKKIASYMQQNHQYFKHINLTNPKKVVVKF